MSREKFKIIDQHFPFSQRGRVLGSVMTSTAVFWSYRDDTFNFFSGIIVDIFQSYRPFFMILCGVSILGTISVCLISEYGENSI